jgi:mycothiol maleylpyruvate isomerase-like protein
VTGDFMTDDFGTETSVRNLYLSTASACIDLIAEPLVGSAWELPSVLAELSVGALAGHLSRGILQVEWFLDGDVPDAAPISAAQYYAPFHDSTDLATGRNRAVRDRGDERAALGQAAIVADVRACLTRLRDRLGAEPPDRRIEALGSSAVRGRVLLLDEYLKVRLVEQTIHHDDLVRSVPGVAVTRIDPAAYESATATLVGAAVHRHGPLPVLHALSRREQDTRHALRVL